MLATQDRQNMMARFLPGCAKYGFHDVRDPQAEQSNSAVAKDLWRKIEANGAEIEAIGQRDIEARNAASRAEEARERERETRRECETYRKQMAEARAQVAQVPPQQRADAERQIAQAEKDMAKSCPPG
jgi:regulator of protease activity HflC (stomatin/prohibitin superfamily)